jgi:ribose/xylose/arabinose/galactoside ABC-type transport system permease subunit
VEKTLLGAIIVAMILNYMTIKGISPHYQRAVTGFIILAAAVLDRLSRGRQNG